MGRKLVCTRLTYLGLLLLLTAGCGQRSRDQQLANNPVRAYVQKNDSSYRYDFDRIIEGEGYKTHVLKMVSGRWLTTKEVREPEWWHWVHLVVPDTVKSSIAILIIGGGDRKKTEPDDASELVKALALKTGTVAIQLHNVPNQPIEFVGDDGGPRSEDWLIAYGWHKFLEAGATEKAVEWLPRLPMTRAAVRAMDAAADYAEKKLALKINRFVVAGASKRGWTTWTTAISDDRVIAIAPIVIDVLNTVPSFKHHWRAYGKWAQAVDDYVNEGIMDWFGSKEFETLLAKVEPFSFRSLLTMPKMLINASGDQFFLPDSWQFYWDSLPGEKHLRYVPNAGHGLDETDAAETLIAFYNSIVTNTPRPDFDWQVKNGVIQLKTSPQRPPAEIRLWQADNPDARDFRIDVLGKAWSSTPVELSKEGIYQLSVEKPEQGWRAFFVELLYSGPDDEPFKLSTGIVVVPDILPYTDYVPARPMGTRN